MSSAGVQSWTYSAIDNSTINGIVISENCPAANINNAIRQAMSSVMQELVYQGADMSASVSMSLAGVDYRFMAVTGSASIVHVGTGRAGLVRNVIWNSPSTLVNSANIICDGGANIVTGTYDVTTFTSLGSGAWRAVNQPISKAISTNDIQNNAVTFAKMQAITDGHLLGASGGTTVEEISVGAGLTLASNTLSTATTPTFSANKNNVNQTGIVSATPTKITFTTEDWDTGGYYDAPNSKFLPLIAGKYDVKAVVCFLTGIVDQSLYYAMIYKNGALERVGDVLTASGTGTIASSVSALIDLNGTTDFIEIYAQGEGPGNKSVAGATANTWFQAVKVT